MATRIKTHRELEVYQMAFVAAMKIFELSKKFPKEETYSLTDQIRRSSRSVCSNLAEAWRKRRYEGAFVSKLSDSEAAETQAWLEFAVKCGYLDAKIARELPMLRSLTAENAEVAEKNIEKSRRSPRALR
jgi:four helix bundle protein